MTETRRPWSPLAFVAGGLAWTGWSVVAAVAGGVDGQLLGVVAGSGLLLAAGLAGFLYALAWSYRFPGGEGAGLAALGGLAFALGQGVRFARGEGVLTTWTIAAGVLALVSGSMLLGAGLARARRIPPWIGVGLVVGSVLFLGFNRLPALALPFGLAWVALGAHLWRHPERPAGHLEPSAARR